jgi:flagellar hook-length control protein FliK
VPRVASQVNASHSQHQSAHSRTPAAASQEPATPFAQLLDNSGGTPPLPSNKDQHDRLQKSSASRTDAASAPSRPDTPTPAPKDAAASQTDNSQDPQDATAPDDATSDDTAKSLIAAAAADGLGQDQDTTKTDATDAVAAAVSTGDPTTAQPVPNVQPVAVAVTVAVVAPVNTSPVPDAGQPATTGAIPQPVPTTSTDAKAAADAIDQAADAPAKVSTPGPQAEGGSLVKVHAAPKRISGSPNPNGSRPSDASGPVDADDDGSPAEPAATGTAQAETRVLPESNPAGKPIHVRLHSDPANQADDSTQQPGETLQTGALASDTANLKHADGAQATTTPQTIERSSSVMASAAQAGAPTASATDTPVPIAGLAIEIAARAQQGRNRFEIRLDPPELGRIDVRLDVDHSGHVTSRLVVERAETLDLLRRDAGDLQRALQDAGLKTSDNGMQFTLRDQGFAGRNDDGSSPNAARLVVPDPDLNSVETMPSGYGRTLGSGLDIRV